jgi:hypothetical protein
MNDEIEKQKKNWHEHIPRMDENRLLKRLLNYKPEGYGYRKTLDRTQR